MTKEKSRQRFTNYFTAVEFVKWDDVAEPVLQFSDDSTMAVAVVRKEVITRGSAGRSAGYDAFCLDVDIQESEWCLEARCDHVNGKKLTKGSYPNPEIHWKYLVK